MATLLATILVFAVMVLAMASGVLVQGRRLRGSCGGTGQSCSCSSLQALSCPRRLERGRAQDSESDSS